MGAVAEGTTGIVGCSATGVGMATDRDGAVGSGVRAAAGGVVATGAASGALPSATPCASGACRATGMVIGLPHTTQNLALSSMWEPQFVQNMTLPFQKRARRPQHPGERERGSYQPFAFASSRTWAKGSGRE